MVMETNVSISNPSRQDTTSRFVWMLRAYGWIIAIMVVVLAGAPLLVLPSSIIYEAQALVVARQVVAPPKALPRLAQAVFYAGAVARQVTDDPAIGGDPATLVPSQLDVIIAEDSVVFTVVGRDGDPNTAAALANAGAVAFTEDLNLGGSGIAAFDIQSRAQVPSQPLANISVSLLVVGGALAGLLLGMGSVALITAVRRPVIDAGDIEPVLHTRVLGTVLLPPVALDMLPGPRGIPGVAPVVRWLAGATPGMVLVASDARATGLRQGLLVMLAVALAPSRPTSVQADPKLLKHIALLRDERPGPRPSPAQRPGKIVLVDGSESPETLAAAGGEMAVVLVVRRGTSRAGLRALAAEYPAPELLGAVLVDFHRNRRNRGRKPAHPGRDRPPPRPPILAETI